jgi:hypothetical protein
MNGAIADPPPNTNRMPNNSSMIMMGASHHFFLTFKNPQMSFKKSMVSSFSLKQGLYLPCFNPVQIHSSSLLFLSTQAGLFWV